MFVPKWKGGEETLAHFATRRLGREAYEKLIDPMASGIFAGDPEKMSLKSCFAKVYNLEQKYGSLIRGMINLQKEAKKTGNKVGAGPGGTLTSFYDGMESMISALTSFLGKRLMTGSEVVSIDRKGINYVISLSDGTQLEAEAVVCATPAFKTSAMVSSIDKNLSALLNEIFFPSVSVICLGYKREKIHHNLRGFGFLIPFKEGRKILGTLWDSSIFPNRAPEGYVLLRTMLGGARTSDLAQEHEQKLISLVIDELRILWKSLFNLISQKFTHIDRGYPNIFRGTNKKCSRLPEYVGITRGFTLQETHHVLLSTGDTYCGPLDGITVVVDNVCLVCGGIDTPFDLGSIWTELREGTP